MAGGADDECDVLVDQAVRQSRPRLHRPQETASPPIPEELLLDIFRRIHDPADLVRAAAACASFLRLITDRSFLRQYRKLHAPPLLGFLVRQDLFEPAIARAASTITLAADFAFTFLPAPASSWTVKDIRGGRVLLVLDMTYTKSIKMVVCDPLHRRYLLLPPITDEVLASVDEWETFLVPPAGTGDKEETAFRVIWMALRGDNRVVLVFSSTTGQWQDGPSHPWVANSSQRQYAYGCFYWPLDSRSIVPDRREKLLVLDIRKMEFSIADAPPEAKGSGNEDIAIVEAGEGRPGMFVRPHDTSDLYFIYRRNKRGSSVQWQLEKTISLGFYYRFAGSKGRHLFLQSTRGFFSLDIKTFQLEMVCSSKYKCSMFWPLTYSNFPPSLLSSPTVASGVEMGTEKETLKQGGAASSSVNGQSSADVNGGAWRSG